MAIAGGEIGEGHFVAATDFGVQVMHFAGESVRREPLGHGVGIEDRAIDPFRWGAEHSVKSNGIGIVGCHKLFGFHYYDEWGRRLWTIVRKIISGVHLRA